MQLAAGRDLDDDLKGAAVLPCCADSLLPRFYLHPPSTQPVGALACLQIAAAVIRPVCSSALPPTFATCNSRLYIYYAFIQLI